MIFWSRLRDSPLKALQNLPNLLELVLKINAYDGVQLHLEEGGFQKLRHLELRDMEGLNSLIMDNGVMPLLQEFHIGPSPQLKEVLLFSLTCQRSLHDIWIQIMDYNIVLLNIYKMSALVTSSDQDGGIYETHALRDSNFSFW
ncbi:hypothetical protein ACFX19_001873 [Malus domestica]